MCFETRNGVVIVGLRNPGLRAAREPGLRASREALRQRRRDFAVGYTARMSECWIVTDGAAGNVRQAMALAQAMGFATPRQWDLYSAAPWRWLAPRCLPQARHAFGGAFAHALARPPTLAIGCGRQGALASRLLRAAGAKAVQILDPRIDTRHWDAVIAPAHDALAGANVISPLCSLHPVDAGWLAAARHAHPDLGALPGPSTAVLLGGPIATVALDAEWWRGVLALLERLRASDGSVLVSASRRTPAWLRAAAQALLPATPGLRWLGADDGENPYPGLLAWADRIVVSPDSVNMISEACATEVPVWVPGMALARGRHARFLRALQARGRIRSERDDAAPWQIAPLIELPAIARQLRASLTLDQPGY